ncbi:MAG: hypothetical protein WCG29_03850 [Desulfomonile sp.]|nr:hypothetical protein [Deltaproteobacteria bacterium]
MCLFKDIWSYILGWPLLTGLHERFAKLIPLALSFSLLGAVNSCTILSFSHHIYDQTSVRGVENEHGLIVSESGCVPYQRWRLPPWHDEMRYVWMVGNYDFDRFDGVEIILYFHGMQAKDYYQAFRKELELLVEKRPSRPFLFVGFVDTPHIPPGSIGRDRWSSLAPREGERPDRLFKTINQVFKAFRARFPHVRKDKTTIVLAGFSGGGKVLNAVGNWLARSIKEDPYAEVFRSRLSKIVYFDCWFEKDVVETIPALLESNPDMKIVATVHMKKPVEHAALLVGKFKMKADKKNNELVGLNGRLIIYRDDSHWNAMICRLREAL